MADETVVDDMQARILGALKDDTVKTPAQTDETNVEAKAEAVTEDNQEAPVEKTKAAIDKKKELNQKVFDVKVPEPVASPGEIDWKAKAQEYEGKVKQYETKAEQEKRYAEETEVFTAIKEANGSRWTPAVDDAVAELIESKEKGKISLYDRLLANTEISAKERMLLITNTALQMVEEPERKLRTEKVKEVKDLGKVGLADVKGESARKRSSKEAMESYRRTGNDADLQEAMGVDEMLNGMFGK